MIGALDRIEIESVGSDPFRLAQALLVQLPHLDGRVPIEEIALALDIVAIEPKPLKSLEGCLQCDPYKSYGQIVVNANSRPRRQRYTIAHELGHFLNERHRPPSEQCFVCTAADMSALFRKDIRYLGSCCCFADPIDSNHHHDSRVISYFLRFNCQPFRTVRG